MHRLCVLTVLVAALPLSASAESYRHGRIRHVEEGVSIQRGTETGSEEAVANLPFLPGDRVWTDGGGRVEFQFAGGALLRLDSASKLDYVAHDDGRDERIVLRLWSGALYLHARDRHDGGFEVETPGGVVTAGGRGVLRIDVQSGETRVSVFEGEASLEAGEAVRLRAGERVYARGGQIEEAPRSFDRGEGDEFAEWDAARQEQGAYASNRPVALPDDVAPYGDELDRHGSWYYETEVGYVWRPYVAAGWQPYSDGRWVWSVFGWTWVPYESWGWAPSHFGRWGFSPARGWYWMPGATWSPAWVSWAVGGDYVGWCPLGYRDRPVFIYESVARSLARGHAVARDGATVAQNPWIYLRRGDVTAHEIGRRRVRLDGGSIQQVRMLDTAQTRLTRDLAVTDTPVTGAVARGGPRNVSTRPTIGDTVPELRSDPMTTIPVVRRRGRGFEGGDPASAGDASAVRSMPMGSAVRATDPTSAAGAAVPRGTHPTDVRTGQRRPEDGSGDTATPRRGRGGDGVEARPVGGAARQREDSSDDRDVLRPMFRPLSKPRGESSDGADKGGFIRPRNEGESRRGGDGDSGRAEARPRDRGARESSPRESSPRESSPREASPRQSAPPPRPEPQAQRNEPRTPPSDAAARHPRKRDNQ
jgi:Family of unknown function (DUF6600)/FecR protein